MEVVLYTAPTTEPISVDELKLHLRIELDMADENEYLEGMIKGVREHVEDITRRTIMTQTWDYYLQEWPEENFIILPFGNLQSVASLSITDSACVEADGTKNLIFTGANTTSASGTYTIASDVMSATSLTGGGTGYVATPTVATQSGDGAIGATITPITYKDSDGTTTTLTFATDYLVETNGEGFGRIVLPYGGSWPTDELYPSNPITIRFTCGWTTQALVPFKVKAAIKMICADMYENRGEALIGQIIHQNDTADRLLASARLWGNF